MRNLESRSVIDGSPLSSATATPVPSFNPAQTDEVVTTAWLDTAETFAAACSAASAKSAQWASVPAPVRGQLIANIGQLVAANKEQLAALVCREMGKPFAESLGEVQEIVDTCTFFAGEGRRLYGQTVPSEIRDKQLFTFRRPLGTMVVITAANFPVAVPSWYIIPALLAGNTVVWKPSELTPAVSCALYEIFANAGVPAGTVNLVLADGDATFHGLESALDQGAVDKVGFTGSTEAGRMVSELCGRHLQTPCLELGGKNPMVVMPDADLDSALAGALFSGYATAGQRCTSLGTIIVHESLHTELVQRLDERLRELVIGEPTKDVFYGPLIDERYLTGFTGWLDRIEEHHTIHGSDGVGRISRANPRRSFTGDPDRGLYVHPVLVDGLRPEDDLYRHETFGPLVGVMPFATEDEAVALADGHGYGLSAAVYTRDPGVAFRFGAQVRCGMLSVNNSTVGAEAHLPFGGNLKSGNGSRQSGLWMLDQVTRWQSMNWDYGTSLRRAQIDTELIEHNPLFRL
ncbi:aldehyde dehydrogenase family protein [Streptomyces sp. NBC_00986]|uniref:aldehyde dehydrogenase family protein n=1 Tax=Streptomyces sp. NBC_00986 TaxID=2903702 RepID=UPI00386B6E4C|nr:aldehyde dehydrogenase family protein [Streptomyces sp. NBC_00986]